jgi:hypothetical protein
MRKPSDLAVEGLQKKDSRGDSLCTFVHETPGWRLARALFPQVIEFTGDAVLKLVEPGLYTKRR